MQYLTDQALCLCSVSQLGVQERNSIRCSVCTDVLKDPIFMPCGHHYCRQCIASHWAKPKIAKSFACPKCLKKFSTQSKMDLNSLISKQLVNTSSEWAMMSCDLCVVKKHRAVKFCLTCTALYCETHVMQHYTVPALQRHTLVEPSDQIGQMVCKDHQRALEIFCRTDRVSICSICAVLKHQHHDVMIENPKQVQVWS